MSKRCTLTQAIGILAPLSPTKAANRLTQGVHDNSCRLYCNGRMIPSNIAPRLMVVVQFENDGSWVARIENVAYAAGGVQPAVVWEFEIDKVRALLPRANPRSSKQPAPDDATASKSPAQEACRQFADRKFPRGWNKIKTPVIVHAAELDPEFSRTVVPFPKRDVWLRGLGRRDKRS